MQFDTKAEMIKKFAADLGVEVVDLKPATPATSELQGVPMVKRRSALDGREFMEREDTPFACSPRSETYWSM